MLVTSLKQFVFCCKSHNQSVTRKFCLLILQYKTYGVSDGGEEPYKYLCFPSNPTDCSVFMFVCSVEKFEIKCLN